MPDSLNNFLNDKQKRTLIRIYMVPTPTDIPWEDIEDLLSALTKCLVGQMKYERSSVTNSDSILKIKLPNAKPAIFHRPHTKECDQGTVKAVRRYLVDAGILKSEFL